VFVSWYGCFSEAHTLIRVYIASAWSLRVCFLTAVDVQRLGRHTLIHVYIGSLTMSRPPDKILVTEFGVWCTPLQPSSRWKYIMLVRWWCSVHVSCWVENGRLIIVFPALPAPLLPLPEVTAVVCSTLSQVTHTCTHGEPNDSRHTAIRLTASSGRWEPSP